MAIVVPILLSYTGAAAAIGTAIGISATAVTAIASVAFQVTGINNKINKAAAKVFGEDLVMFANIAGAVYGAVNGGFGGGGGAESAAGLTEAGGALSTKAMLDGTTAFGANSAAGAFELADGMSALSTGDFSGTTDAFGNSTLSPGDANAVELSAARTPEVSKGVDLIGDSASLGKDANPLTDPSVSKVAESGATAPKAAATDAAKSSTTTIQNTASQQSAAGTNAGGAKAAADVTGKQLTTTATKPGSFFDKLLSNDKAVGEVIKGVGTGIVGAAQSKAEKEKLAWQKQRYTQTPTTRIVQ